MVSLTCIGWSACMDLHGVSVLHRVVYPLLYCMDLQGILHGPTF